MSRQTTLPRLLVRILEWGLPPARRADVLGDLEASHRARIARVGERAARRHLRREVRALLMWRLGGGARRSRASSAREVWSGGSAAGGPRRGRAAGRGGTMGRDLVQDLRFAVRTLARRPGFTVTAVLVLALGIGAPTTVLTLVNRVFFWHPPDVTQPDRLVRVWRSWAPGQGGGALGNPDYEYYRNHASTFSGLAASGGYRPVVLSSGEGAVDQIPASFISDNYFQVLGAPMALGRSFVPEENRDPGTHPVAVISYGLWQRRFAADPHVLGRTISLNGHPFTVVGVGPRGFAGLSPAARTPDVWLPLAMFGAVTHTPYASWWVRMPHSRANWLLVVGRLAPGITLQAAQANLSALCDANAYEGKPQGEGVLVSRQYLYSPGLAASLTTLTRMLLGVVALVLLIAVANVTVLLLSRATARNREMGIRVAVGAGRGRLVRQLLAESLALALAGGVVGVGLTYLLSHAAGSLLPVTFFVGAFTPDVRVLAAAFALTLLTAILAGLAPALHAARADVSGSLAGTHRAGGRSRGRNLLVIGQVALSLVLVAGAVLFARSFWSARTQDIGFRTDHTLVLGVDLRTGGYSSEEGITFIPRALERLRAVPGVQAVTTSEMIPFQGDWTSDVTVPPGARAAASAAGDTTIEVGRNTVAPGYFRLMGIPIVRGRAFGAEDVAAGAAAAVVNQTLARRLWPGEDPVGKTLNGEYTVVGVARDATYYELGEKPTTQAYTDVLQYYGPDVHFLLRTQGPPADLAPAAEAALREIDPSLAFNSTTTLDSVFEEVTARYRVSAVLVGLFGALALLLAAAGLYGVVSFFVTGRTREIGVRMALGAGRGRVAADVLGLGLRLAGVGVVLGLAGALLLRHFVASLLYGVRPGDPWALAGACLLLLAVTALASLSPARRATRIDPMEAIRAE